MYREDSNKILDRMLSNSNTSKIEGTYILDALSPVSKELSKSKTELEEVLLKVFAKTACENNFSKELDLKCMEHGIFRKQGKKATGIVTFTGVKNTKIPIGTLVQTELGLQYKTTREDTIKESGTVDIPIEALQEGTAYNVKANSINQLPIKLIKILNVNNKENIETGRDTEDDKSLYNRLCIKVQTPSTSGNIYDYMNWSLEINGVGNCIVKPLWNGNGTVKVILVNSSGRCPSQEIIKNVKENIEKKRPIGADVTVVGVKELNLKVETKILINKNLNLEDLKKQIISNINNYLKDISLKSNIVRYNKIANCILNIKEIADYTELKINESNKDIQLENNSIAILESVVVSSAT